jgi:alpha-D-ribose 1-methylphosphonate 5-triphosphate synthase subunit PhnH
MGTLGSKNPMLGSYQTFRTILKAMSHPGQLVKIKSKAYVPELLNKASAAVCLTMLDHEIPLWTDLSWSSSAFNWFQSQCGCSLVTEPCMAHFALITQPAFMPPLSHFKIGDDQRPGNAATLIIQVERFNGHQAKVLYGAGIKTTTYFAPTNIPAKFWEEWQLQTSLLPLGVDAFFTCDDILAALPRTTHVSDPIVSSQIKIKKGDSDLNRPKTDRYVCT